MTLSSQSGDLRLVNVANLDLATLTKEVPGDTVFGNCMHQLVADLEVAEVLSAFDNYAGDDWPCPQ